MMTWTEETFRAALEGGEFELFYQPQVTGDGRTVAGAEALVRRITPDGTVSGPGSFVGAFERLGFIGELTTHLFPKVCAATKRWPGLKVAVNFSPTEFRTRGLVSRLIAAAEAAGADPRQIEIEITEGLFFEDPDRAESMLGELRAAGFSIALDDFGTGYSSLAYLLRFPVDKIKIDRSFVQDVPRSLKAAAIIHALIALARAIGLKVVAEGVETEEQRVFLKAAGCHLLQGYLFSPPVPAREFDKLLAASTASSAPGTPAPPATG